MSASSGLWDPHVHVSEASFTRGQPINVAKGKSVNLIGGSGRGYIVWMKIEVNSEDALLRLTLDGGALEESVADLILDGNTDPQSQGFWLSRADPVDEVFVIMLTPAEHLPFYHKFEVQIKRPNTAERSVEIYQAKMVWRDSFPGVEEREYPTR